MSLTSQRHPEKLPEVEFGPWVRKIPWKRAQQPTPLILPGESHGQRSLIGYSPKGHKKPESTSVGLKLSPLAHFLNCVVTPALHVGFRRREGSLGSWCVFRVHDIEKEGNGLN